MNNRDFRRPEPMSIPRLTSQSRPNQDSRYQNQDGRYPNIDSRYPNQDSRYEIPASPGRLNQDRLGNGGGLPRFNESPPAISGRVNQGFNEPQMYDRNRDDNRPRNNGYGNSYRKRERYSDEGSELPIRKVLQIVLAEILGTCMMLFVGCLGTPNLAPITFGLSVALAVQTFGHISGAHLNPSITIAAVIMEEIELKMVPFYLIGEFVGAMLAVLLLYVTIIWDLLVPMSYCVTTIAFISPVQGLFLEIIITAFLVLLVCGIWDKKNEHNTSPALKIGVCMTGIFLTAGPYTGASLNSFRTLAPAIMSGYYDFHWIYWVGPNVGAVLGALIYKYFLLDRHWQE